jgi:putative nucleotidyltransferase with HDIG domain
VLRVATGVTVFALVTDQRPIERLEPGRWVVAVLLAALAMKAANAIVVDLVISVQRRERPLTGAWGRIRPDLRQDAALYLLGLFMAVLGAHYPWAILLLAAPAWMLHRSLRDSLALRQQTRQALEELANVVDRQLEHSAEHSRRVAMLARATAESFRLSDEQVETIELAARLHDIGKLGITPALFTKAGPLTEAEWIEMHRHPQLGAEMMARFPELNRGRAIVLAHHEWYDGSGYPHGLAGERIPLGARIVAVADAWDAMLCHRPYRWALPPAQARAELERGRGTQFDPAVVDAFRRVLVARPDLAERRMRRGIPIPPSTAPG